MNTINTILFDLDGTLLPMDQNLFTKIYMQELGYKGAELGYGAKELVHAVLTGLEVMVANDGEMTNEERFWEFFISVFGGKTQDHVNEFEKFYLNEYARVAEVVQPTPLAKEYVQNLREKGYQLVLATNPIFPRIATLERISWAGLDEQDFALITTYENSRFTKPHLNYYQDILDTIDANPENCLMIGNDVQEDLCAAKLGMEVFLVTDDIINSTEEDVAIWPQGDRQALLDFVVKLPTVTKA